MSQTSASADISSLGLWHSPNVRTSLELHTPTRRLYLNNPDLWITQGLCVCVRRWLLYTNISVTVPYNSYTVASPLKYLYFNFKCITGQTDGSCKVYIFPEEGTAHVLMKNFLFPLCFEKFKSDMDQVTVTVLLVCPGWPPDVSVCWAHGLLFVWCHVLPCRLSVPSHLVT